MVAFGVVLLALVHEPPPREVIAYAKQLDVKKIDSRLGSERYEVWLTRTLGPDATITWESDDCGEGGNGYGDVPVCITAEAKLRPRGQVVISIAVGSFRGGLGGVPVVFFGMIEGLGPREDIKAGDLPLLKAKVRAARTLAAELSRRPDVPPDDDGWIRHVEQMPVARLVPRSSGDMAFGDWIAARAGAGAKVEWFVEGCGHRGRHGGPPVDLTGDKDEWAFVAVGFETADVHVSTKVRIGTCRKGIWGKAIASPARLYDKRPGHPHFDEVSLEALETRLSAFGTRQAAQPPTKEK
jgi:hypothetical protein